MMLALTKASPLMALMAVVFTFAATFPLMDRNRWRVTLLAVLWGIGLYAVCFFLVSYGLSPVETVAGKGMSAHKIWMEGASKLCHQTSIPVGSLVGWWAATIYWYRRVNAGRKIPTPNRFWIYGGLAIATLGTVAAIDSALKNVSLFGKLVVLKRDQGRFHHYPVDVDSWFAFHWKDEFFAISYPGLVVGGLLLVAGLGMVYWSGRKRQLKPHLAPMETRSAG